MRTSPAGPRRWIPVRPAAGAGQPAGQGRLKPPPHPARRWTICHRKAPARKGVTGRAGRWRPAPGSGTSWLASASGRQWKGHGSGSGKNRGRGRRAGPRRACLRRQRQGDEQHRQQAGGGLRWGGHSGREPPAQAQASGHILRADRRQAGLGQAHPPATTAGAATGGEAGVWLSRRPAAPPGPCTPPAARACSCSSPGKGLV